MAIELDEKESKESRHRLNQTHRSEALTGEAAPLSARGIRARAHGLVRRALRSNDAFILVCHSYFLRLDQKQLERAKPYPPLATLQVAAMLRKAGHQVSFFDAMLADGIEEYDRMLARRRAAGGAALRG